MEGVRGGRSIAVVDRCRCLGLALAALLAFTACGPLRNVREGGGGEDLSGYVEPLASGGDLSAYVEPLPSGDLGGLVAPLVKPGQGTIRITRERHGTYTSARGNPVTVDAVDHATITFALTPDQAERYRTTAGSVSWDLTLTATETGKECTAVQKAAGGGTFAIGDGPTLDLGIDLARPFAPDPNAYTLGVNAAPAEDRDGDPATHYKVTSTLCGGEVYGERTAGTEAWWPFLVAIGPVSGKLIEGSTALTGRYAATEPSLGGGPDAHVAVTWSIRLP